MRLAVFSITLLLLVGCGGSGTNNAPSVPAPESGFSLQPLAAVSPGANLLFTRLEPEQTGIVFESQWQPDDPLSERLMSSFAGSGVALGDVDGDGRPDIYLTRPNGGPALYRNLGDFRFEDITKKAKLHAPDFWCAGPTFGDIDNDGDLDLHVCGQNAANRLYVNNGKGKFREVAATAGLAYEGNSLMANFGDIDNDGDLDLFLVTNRGTVDPKSDLGRYATSNAKVKVDDTIADYFGSLVVPGSGPDAGPKVFIAGERDRLFENRGDGTFTDISDSAGIRGHDIGQNAALWDFDGDGHLDIYVTNDFTAPDRLWRNNGDKTFTDVAATALPMTPWFGMGCDAADINNDGRMDLIAGDMSASTHYKAKLAMGDMASTSWMLNYGAPRQLMRNALLVNTGTDRFNETAFLAGVDSTDWSWATLFGDFDLDGWQDLFVCNGMTRDWMNSDVGDNKNMKLWINRDPLRERNFAFRNTGGSRFENTSKSWGLDDEGVSYGAARADFDGDGDPDLLVSNFQDQPWIYRNNGTASNRLAVCLRGTTNRRGIGATVTVTTSDGLQQTRELHTTRGFLSCSDDTLFFGLGEASEADITVRWPGGSTQLHESLPVGHLVTIYEQSGSTAPATPKTPPLFSPPVELADSQHLEVPFDDFQRQPLLPNRLSSLGSGLAVGDMDGDGDDDLYAGGAGGQSGRLFENRDGQLSRVASTALPESSIAEEFGAVWFDANRDGRLDLFTAAGGVEIQPGQETALRDILHLNLGGTMRRAAIPDVRVSSGPVAAADFDRDGDIDLFIGGRSIPGEYPAPAQSYILLTEEVGFRAQPLKGAEGLVTAAAWSDTDNDGWPDLHLAMEWGSVQRWRNVDGKLERAPMPDLPGWWSSILPVDIDHDGDIDLAAGNTGLNTKYHPDAKHPTRIYYGTFKPGTPKRIVEACYKGNELLPIRGKSCSTAAMPFLNEAFPTFHKFAGAKLPDIYGDKLGSTQTFEAHELRSGLFRNDGTGAFTFEPFPDGAQVSPIFGMVALPAREHGHVDLVCAQNFFGPQPETGRFAGGVGVVLAGQPDGSFDALPAHESGIVWPGDAKGLVLADFDGDQHPELLLANNEGPIQTSELGRALRSVRLQGPPGNPTGIGARLTATRPSGVFHTQILAGSGYLSQSAPLAWFPSDITAIEVLWPDGTASSAPGDARQITHPKHKPVDAQALSAKADNRGYANFQAKLGVKREQERDIKRANWRYEEALLHDTQSIEALFGLGRLAYKAGDPDGALFHIESGLEIAPGHTMLLDWKKNILSEQKK